MVHIALLPTALCCCLGCSGPLVLEPVWYTADAPAQQPGLTRACGSGTTLSYQKPHLGKVGLHKASSQASQNQQQE